MFGGVGDGFFEEMRRVWRRTALRFGRWPRRVLAIGCLALAVLSAVDATDGATARVSVVVARIDLPAGVPIRTGQVTVTSWPARLSTTRSLHRVHDAVGRVPVSAIGSGEAVTTTRLLGVDLAVGLPPDWVVATVAIADATTARVLRPGDHVELIRPAVPQEVTSAAGPAVVLAHNVRVLAVLSRAGPEDGVSVAVAVDEATALRLSETSGTPLLATLRAR
jgi:Flp pilus assembly protein CpaB